MYGKAKMGITILEVENYLLSSFCVPLRKVFNSLKKKINFLAVKLVFPHIHSQLAALNIQRYGMDALTELVLDMQT